MYFEGKVTEVKQATIFKFCRVGLDCLCNSIRVCNPKRSLANLKSAANKAFTSAVESGVKNGQVNEFLKILIYKEVARRANLPC